MSDFEDRMRKRARKAIKEIAQAEGVQRDHVIALVQASLQRAREEKLVFQAQGNVPLALYRERTEGLELTPEVRLLP